MECRAVDTGIMEDVQRYIMLGFYDITNINIEKRVIKLWAIHHL